LHRAGGAATEAQFLTSLANGDFTPADLAEENYGRAAELVQQYSDLRLGTTDACVIALTERLRLPEVATLDRRHFSVVRPAHVGSLTLLP
jgi:predicted nucleic acid-binding protein